jgi:hypothetical protein
MWGVLYRSAGIFRSRTRATEFFWRGALYEEKTERVGIAAGPCQRSRICRCQTTSIYHLYLQLYMSAFCIVSCQDSGSLWSPTDYLPYIASIRATQETSVSYTCFLVVKHSTNYGILDFCTLNYFLILKCYLHNRHFLVEVETEYTELSSVNTVVPQGSVLGSLLYLLYTADLPTWSESTTVTFADDTAVLATNSDPAIASQKLQTNLLAIQNWFEKWRMKANGCKSIHVTFTTRKKRAPRLK